MSPSMSDSASPSLLDRAAGGDQRAWAELWEQYRDRLHRMVALRLDRRLQGRIDASDIVQEAYLEAAMHLASYQQQPGTSFFLWLRGITGNKLLETHRNHLGTQRRDAGREVSLYRGALPEASSAALAAQLLGREPSPSSLVRRAERQLLVQEALNSMDPLDREILALRHLEQLSNAEAAQVLGVQESAASKRHIRALKRLKEVLASLPGGDDL